MNYIESFDLFGVKAKQNPSITSKGAPTTATEGAVGCLYMDTDTGDMYKCASVKGGEYTWIKVAEGGNPVQVAYEQPQNADASMWVNLANSFKTDTSATPSIEGVVGIAINAMMVGGAFRYESIAAALHDDTSASGNTVLGYYCGSKHHIMLLEDITSTRTITIDRDCVFHLNGHKLSFTAAGAHLDIKTASEVTIDGTVAGSEIDKNVSSSAAEYTLKATGTAVHLIGGKYSMVGSLGSGSRLIDADDITMAGCVVLYNVNAVSTMIVGVNGVGEISKCSFDGNNATGVAYGICIMQTGSLTMRQSAIAVKSSTTLTNYGSFGIRSLSPSVTLENCVISSVSTEYRTVAYGVGLYKSTTATNKLTINNCHITADGWSDTDIDGDGDADFVPVYAISNEPNTELTINGGYYWGARDAISVMGIGRINGGVLEGCQHGGGYMGSEDIKVKNAIFRNVPYKGWHGLYYAEHYWFDGSQGLGSQGHGGAVYCGSEFYAAKVEFDNCLFEVAEGHKASYGVVAKCNNTQIYLSNCEVKGNITSADLRVGKPETPDEINNAIYVGKNVSYRNAWVLPNNTLDTTTYADSEFGFETENVPSDAVLSVKDERGNWIGVPMGSNSENSSYISIETGALGDIESALDSIIAIQESLIGGEGI